MDYMSEYKSKLRTPEEAVKVVKSGDWIDYGCVYNFPVLLDRALAKRKDELSDVKARGYCIGGPIEIVECDPDREVFTYNSWHMLGYERKLCARGLCNFIPMLFRNLGSYYRRYLTVNVAMCSVTPMDKHGYFNFSFTNCSVQDVFSVADIIIVEVNENLPRCYGLDNVIHVSDVDFIVEGEHAPLFDPPESKPSDIDNKIADLIVERMRNGSIIQLGVGGMPDAIGKKIADSDLKDLGVHTELLTPAYYDMHVAGKLNNKSKKAFYGKGVYSFTSSTKKLADWLDDNPSMMAVPISYVNNTKVVAELDNFVSINNCLNVDLYGQVASEAAGTRHISGTGGQLDFLTGAYDNPTGQSFIAFSSTFTDKNGVMHSRIVPTFNGDIVTDPRSQTFYLVTEYGIENLAGMSTWERAEALIRLAHPDFREDLIKKAQELKIWRRSNR